MSVLFGGNQQMFLKNFNDIYKIDNTIKPVWLYKVYSCHSIK